MAEGKTKLGNLTENHAEKAEDEKPIEEPVIALDEGALIQSEVAEDRTDRQTERQPSMSGPDKRVFFKS